MLKNLIALTAAAALGLVSMTDMGLAAPIDGGAILHSLNDASPVQKARVWCYNKYTGAFLYWGYCHPTYPRVYCRNRYTGQFLYWGACRHY